MFFHRRPCVLVPGTLRSRPIRRPVRLDPNVKAPISDWISPNELENPRERPPGGRLRPLPRFARSEARSPLGLVAVKCLDLEASSEATHRRSPASRRCASVRGARSNRRVHRCLERLVYGVDGVDGPGSGPDCIRRRPIFRDFRAPSTGSGERTVA